MRQQQAPKFCHLCGEGLSGRYFRYSTRLVVCQHCERTRPRCERCGVPLSDAALAGAVAGVRICAPCARVAQNCAACGLPITGTWYTFEELLPSDQVRHFCARCVRHRPRCDLCRAPTVAEAPRLPDGQYRCAECAQRMVTTPEEVARVFEEALAAFAALAGARLRSIPRVEVVTRRHMGEVRRTYERARHGPGTGSLTDHHVLGFFVHRGGESTIYVEAGLPHALLLGTLAHELGHAWQADYAPKLRDPLLCEGFAEWVAHRVLVARGEHHLAARATRRDDIYGRGLRHYLAVEAASGKESALRMARGEGE